jgi:hypothetical protein
VFAARFVVIGFAHAPLVHNFVVAPTKHDKGKHFGNKIRPRIVHIVHTGINKFGGGLVRIAVARFLYVPLNLPHKHLYAEQHRPDDVVVFTHFLVGFHAPAPVQLL